MSDLRQKDFSTIYGDVLTTTNTGFGLDNVLRQLQDGFGNASPISLSKIAVNFNRNGFQFLLDNVALTAQVQDINSMCSPNPVARGTGALLIPCGTTAQRPNPAQNGMIRYNTDIHDVETYVNGEWVS